MLNDFKTKIDGLKLIKTGFKLVNQLLIKNKYN